MARLFLFLGAGLGGLGVMAGAFASHALRAQLARASLATFETAARYQLVHALALLVVGLLLYGVENSAFEKDAASQARAVRVSLHLSGIAFVVGGILFSGSLYGLSLGAFRSLGWVTPLGGLSLIGGWLGLAIAALQLPSRSQS